MKEENSNSMDVVGIWNLGLRGFQVVEGKPELCGCCWVLKFFLVSEVSNKLNEIPISMDVGFLRQRDRAF